MKFRLILDLAGSLLAARLRQSLVAAAGVATGVGLFITMVSFMTGLNHLLDGLMFSRTPHLRLYHEVRPSPRQPLELSARYRRYRHFISSIKPRDRGREIANSAFLIRALQADARVAAIAPKISSQVFYTTGAIELAGVLEGIVVAQEDQLFSLGDYVVAGSLGDLALMPNSILIGKGIADKMMVEVGDRIRVSAPGGQEALLKIAGILQLGIAEVDKVQSYTSLKTARQLLGKPPAYLTDIQVMLQDQGLAPALAREYAGRYGLQAMDYQTANAQYETGSSVRTLIAYAVGLTLLLVAGFGIYNILNMLIYEKMDAIAILKATGFASRDIRQIFMSLSLLIGLAGGLSGLLLGFALSLVIDAIPFRLEAMPSVTSYPIHYDPLFYLTGICFALLCTAAAGFFPARKASQADPVLIIRGK